MDIATETGSSAVTTGIQRLLVPLDGSEAAEVALRWLPLLPAREITLLRVCDSQIASATEATAYLAEAATRLSPFDRIIATQVAMGSAAEEIVTAATTADLVMMSTRGAGGGGRLLFGSVADRVARHSPAPTLLIRGGTEPVSAAALRRIVVPLDGSSAAERALPVAIELARTLACDIHLVAVDERGDDLARPDESSPAAYLQQCADRLRLVDPSVTTERRTGSPATELLAAVAPGDLLVMTTHGRGSARRWQIGTVAEKILRQATAPVVLVRADRP
jgi:nucleotide-binding universal stress UspA family protein